MSLVSASYAPQGGALKLPAALRCDEAQAELVAHVPPCPLGPEPKVAVSCSLLHPTAMPGAKASLPEVLRCCASYELQVRHCREPLVFSGLLTMHTGLCPHMSWGSSWL